MTRLIRTQTSAGSAEDLLRRADVYRKRADLVNGRLARLALLQLARDCDQAAARVKERPSGSLSEARLTAPATMNSEPRGSGRTQP